MSRKLQASLWKDEHRRRSPRISALDAGKVEQATRVSEPVLLSQNSTEEMGQGDDGNELGPPSWTRARKKRKLRPLHQGRESPNRDNHPTNTNQPLVVQAKDSPKHEDHATYTGRSSIVASTLWIPEKRMLELILDILQRRDTHEIFSEPVDPQEVEDYYEIIKEPMDFGTMRAKLHEGMYKNLEQFEHDVFLISRNAMHFNSSGTIYFRQARAINELAKKVFHVLKTEPDNLELEFSMRRRRPGRRRPQGEARDSNFSSCPKHGTNVRSSNMTIDLTSKGVPCSTSGSSNLRRSIRVTPWCPRRDIHTNTRGHEILSGPKDGKSCTFPEADRRCNNRPWMSFLNENDSIISTIYSNPKSLVHVNQRDIGYRESLMLFVKDLGPTAQMIAKRKLHGWVANVLDCQTPSSNCWFQASKCQNPTTYDSGQFRHSTLDTVITTTTSQNFLDHCCGHPTVLANTSDRMKLSNTGKGEKTYIGNGMGIRGASEGEMDLDSDGKSTYGAFRREVCRSSGMNVGGVFGGYKVHQNQNAEIDQLHSCSSPAGVGGLNFSGVGNKNTAHKSMTMIVDADKLDGGMQASELASEHPQSNMFEFMLRNTDGNSCVSSSGPLETMRGSNRTKGSMHGLGSQFMSAEEQVVAAPAPCHGVSMSSQTGETLDLNQPVAMSSRFIFDLPYLKSRLDQMNSLGMR